MLNRETTRRTYSNFESKVFFKILDYHNKKRQLYSQSLRFSLRRGTLYVCCAGKKSKEAIAALGHALMFKIFTQIILVYWP